MVESVSSIRATPGRRCAMFEKFTDRARLVIVRAQEESRALNHDHVGPEHILLALMHESRGMAAHVLSAMGITEDRVRQQLDLRPGQGSPSGHVPFTPQAKKTLELSLREALQLSDSYIGTEHLLLGLMRQDEIPAAQALRELGADLDTVRAEIIRLRPEMPTPVKVAKVLGEPDEPVRAEVESLRDEISRLRALLRRHDIDPDEDRGPGGGGRPGAGGAPGQGGGSGEGGEPGGDTGP
jgi:ATP-dependent Clp protease ATP-binding subunit ClpC